MDASKYASLFKLLGKDDVLDPNVPLDTDVSEITPEQLTALQSDVPTEVRIPPPGAAPEVPASPAAPTAEEIVRQRLTKPATLGEHYDIPMSAATPSPRTENPNRLAAGLSRAGTTIGSALGGVKPNYEFSNQLHDDGARSALSQDKSNDDLTSFKQQLLARALTEKAASRTKYNGALNDPNSAEYKNMVARFNGDVTSKRYLEKAQMEARLQGLPHLDLNTVVDFKPNQAVSATNSDRRFDTAEANKFTRQEDTQQHSKEMAQLQFNLGIQKMDYGDALRVLGEERHATNPNRDFKRDASGNQIGAPTSEQSKLVLVNDAGARTVKMLAQELLTMAKNADPLDVANPASNIRVLLQQKHQDLMNQVRVLERFGVPSGKDMEQLAREVQDPTWYRNVFIDRAFAPLEQLIQATDDKANLYADTFGYGTMGTAKATPAPQALRNTAKSEIGLGAGPEVVAPQGGAGKVRVINENGQPGSIPAASVDAWLQKNPNRRRAQ